VTPFRGSRKLSSKNPANLPTYFEALTACVRAASAGFAQAATAKAGEAGTEHPTR